MKSRSLGIMNEIILSRRQTEILLLLMQRQTFIKGSQLADIFDVSVRSIRSDIASINEMLNEWGLNVTADNKNGYQISEVTLLKMRQFNVIQRIADSLDFDLPETKNERKVYLLFNMLFGCRYTQQEIEDLFYISSSQAYSDLKELQKWTKDYTGVVLRKENEEYSIQDKESVIRSLISGIYTQRSNLFLEVKYSFFITGNTSFWNVIDYLSMIIEEFSRTHGYMLSGFSIYTFAVDIALTYQRCSQGFVMEKMEHGHKELEDDLKQFLLSKDEIFSKLTDNDYAYLIRRFISKDFLGENPFFNVSEKTKDVLEQFSDSIRKLGIRIESPYMGKEIERIVYRHHNQFYFVLDRRKEIFKDNPLNYYFSIILKYFIERNYAELKLNSTDLVYLALSTKRFIRFDKKKAILISDSDVYTMENARTRIQRVYQDELEIIKEGNHYSINCNDHDYDFIISTVSLNVPVEKCVYINELCDRDSIEKIGDFLDSFQKEETINYSLSASGDDLDSVLKSVVSRLKDEKSIGCLDIDYVIKNMNALRITNERDGSLYVTIPLLAANHFKQFIIHLDKPFVYHNREYDGFSLLVFSSSVVNIRRFFSVS